MKTNPADLPLTLSADVLRLPYPPAVRLVLAEIVSLHAANRGRCDCSDQHLADRLTLSTDTVSRAVKQLHAEGLLIKVVVKEAGFHRTLTPLAAAIEAKAKANPYPQNAGSPTRKMPEPYPQSAAPPTRNLRSDLPAKCGTNTYTTNLPVESSKEEENSSFAFAPEPAAAEEIFEAEEAEELPTPVAAQRPAAHTKGAAAALEFPGWATDAFRAEWAEWLAFRQTKRDKLKPASQQKMLRKLADFDEGFCHLLFDKAITNGYTGLVFDDTPAKYEVYKRNQSTPYDPTHVRSTRPNRSASGFDIEAAFALGSAIAHESAAGGAR